MDGYVPDTAGSVALEVVWVPGAAAAGGARHTIGLKWAGKYRLQAIVYGTALAAKEPPKKANGARVRRALNNSSNVDTSTLAIVKAATKAATRVVQHKEQQKKNKEQLGKKLGKAAPAVAQRRLQLKRSANSSVRSSASNESSSILEGPATEISV
jgi:hypothetical protein